MLKGVLLGDFECVGILLCELGLVEMGGGSEFWSASEASDGYWGQSS